MVKGASVGTRSEGTEVLKENWNSINTVCALERFEVLLHAQ